MFNKINKSIINPKKIRKEKIGDNIIMQADLPDSFKSISNEDFKQRKALCPITFTDNGLLTNYQPFVEPIHMFTAMNGSIAKNPKHSLNPLSISELRGLDNNNRNIIILNTKNYIKQQSFLSFCGYLDSLYISQSYIFNFLNIKETVLDHLNRNYSIDNILSKFYFSSDTGFSSMDLDDEDRIMATVSYSENITLQIANVILLDISSAVESAVNDIILQIHVVPNIKEIYNELCKMSPTLREIYQKTPSSFPISAATFIKENIMNNIEDLFSRAIIPAIDQAIKYSGMSMYYIYGDYAKLKIEDEENNK